jgi:hypothetical protein
MITIEFSPSGIAASDFEADTIAKNILEAPDAIYNFSTANVILAVRAAVARSGVDNPNVEFLFEGQRLQLRKCAKLDHWPAGFIDHMEHWLCAIIDAEMKARGVK